MNKDGALYIYTNGMAKATQLERQQRSPRKPYGLCTKYYKRKSVAVNDHDVTPCGNNRNSQYVPLPLPVSKTHDGLYPQ